ncbi:MAG: protein kinase [Chitinispirillia bacterium]|nr:protein kinase [Chitinispirillia bacterium]
MDIEPFDPKKHAADDDGGDDNVNIQNMLSNLKHTNLSAGAVIGKYRIIEEIGRGGMAVVYKALQTDLNREVALKVVSANLAVNYNFVRRFLSEAHSVAKLNHPYIVDIYEAASQNDIYYLAMEFVPGVNLYDHTYDTKPKLSDALEIVSKLAEALSYAHKRKIIHRDLKLNNVIMREPLYPVLIDFGLAKAMEEVDEQLTKTGEIMGSPAYMAPECLDGSAVDHRSDICSLGIMLYEMITFRNPYFDRRNVCQTTLNVIEASPVAPRKLNPRISADVEAITLKAMAKDPAKRYQSMEEFCADIKSYLRGGSLLAKPEALPKRTLRLMRQKWVPLVIAALIIAFGGIFTANNYLQNQKGYSHWQLVHSEFPPSLGQWVLGGEGTEERPFEKQRGSADQFRLEREGQTLFLSSPGFSYARLEWRFTRDILIEFDVHSADHSIYNTGIFLFGNNPDSAYCIHINRGASGESGITFPGSNFLFQDIESWKIPWQAKNRAAVERSHNSISFSINGVLVARVFDYFPPLGKNHERIGFFVNGSSVQFSNLKVYRRTIPMNPGPAIAADRLWERGDFESAIDEYKGVMLDQAALANAMDLHIKIAECQIRLGNYSDARKTLSKTASLQSSGDLKALAMFMQGMAHKKSGKAALAEDEFAKAAAYFKHSSVNFYIMSKRIASIDEMIKNGLLDNARDYIKEYTPLYYTFSTHWGNIYLQILNIQATAGDFEQALVTSNEISSIYGSNSAIMARAQIILGKAYLNAGQTVKAAEMFNLSIQTQSKSDNVWEAWFRLAEIYELDMDYKKAQPLYLKIRNKCPPTSEIFWMAMLKCAEYGINSAVPLDQAALLHTVVNSNHPFPRPRLIANYYLNRIDEKTFRENYASIYPSDLSYRYYIVRKQLLNEFSP